MVASPMTGSVARLRAPLLLTGPPAAGKSTAGRLVAQSRPSCTFIDVDDLRHLIVSGHRAPWDPDGGPGQHLLGVKNACGLVQAFVASGFESVLADMVTPETLHLYRQLEDGVVIVAFRLSFEEAVRRASTRVPHITDDEFKTLHELSKVSNNLADVVLDVDALDISAQARLVERVWSTQQPSRQPTLHA